MKTQNIAAPHRPMKSQNHLSNEFSSPILIHYIIQKK